MLFAFPAMSSSAAAVLFEDKYVKLTEEEIEIKWYYFPTVRASRVVVVVCQV